MDMPPDRPSAISSSAESGPGPDIVAEHPDVRHALNASARRAEGVNSEAALTGLWQRIDQNARLGTGQRRTYFGHRWILGTVAACAVVVGGIVLTQRTATTPSITGPRVYTTPTGRPALITLADGSWVTLAPQSRLEVRSDISSARALTLEGEAYFDVRSAARPFLVRSGTVTTRVLGTTFTVRRYHAEPVTQVAVMSGKVLAASPHAQVTIAAGTHAILTDSTATTIAGDVDSYADWTHGRLVFHDTPVPAMLTALSRWYAYEFRLADSTLTAERVTAEFRTEAPDETLAILKGVLNVTLTVQGSTITLHPRRGNATPMRRGTQHTWSNPLPEVGK